MSRFLHVGVVSMACVLLTGCTFGTSTDTPDMTLDQPTYARVFGEAMCFGVAKLNRAGKLKDADALAVELDPAIRDYVLAQGYSEEAWAAAKAKYYPGEEQEQLTKMYFLKCVTGI